MNAISRLHTVFATTQCYGPVAEQVVASAERTLGVAFPPSHREFVKRFGACWGGASVEIAGLPAEASTAGQTPLWSSVLQDTLVARRALRGQLPSALLAIASDGSDCAFYIDTSFVSPDGESPVIVFGPSRNGAFVAHSFIEFAERAARGESVWKAEA